MTTEKATKPVTDLFEQAMKNYEQALKTGLKLQEEATKWWTTAATQSTTPQDWQKKVKAMTDDIIPETQKRMDECLKLIEQNSKTSVDLLKKAVAAAQATSVQDAQNKFLAFWEGSLNALRDTAQAVTQTNTKAIESWMEYARKSVQPLAEGRAAKA
jgi:rubrerythrin